jgi:murein DD-endopeptidase MepM/ murein hydrolase activator NlpD
MPLCHAKKILVKAGDQPALGELLMIADNTGFSTGLHTHMGLYRVEYTNATIHILDQNDAEGSFDPAFFFTGEYAIDQATYSTLMKNGMRYFQHLAGLI